MFLSSYLFPGEPAQLKPAFDRFVATQPGQPDLLVCVESVDGLLVLDACPDRETFVEFSTSAEFAAAVAAAGLPTPLIEPIGDVHAATLATPVGR
jgi:hypothetical protein